MEIAEIFKSFIEYGIFAVLFIWLFLSNQKKSSEREKSYHEIINGFTEELAKNTSVLQEVSNTLLSLKEDIKK